jgi:cyclase
MKVVIIGGSGFIWVSAGSLFVFKGKYRAVLINYPVQQRKDEIIGYSKGIDT